MHIGNSTSLLKYQGCLITSLCMIYSKFHPFFSYLPSQATKEWKFIGNLLDWSTNFKGMEFVKRVISYNPEEVESYVKKSFGVVIQVQTKTGVHWMAVDGWGYLGKPVCYDPIDGKITYNPYGFLGKYARPLGYAVMQETLQP